ncbi:triacylglycerol lipase OBL1-like [Hibiscus syriacus]|uniref:triacylglycerol lipase OBL1-like n=1 Tax=Hibiscus syriacus TaxID=106335 RepID=UPI001921341D|nr:triacylglycerol lipase OBL1-like [Hibiscus syriacus]
MGSIVVDFFQVNPKEASSIDLVKLLFSSNIKKRKFINSSYDREESFAYRFIIVLSVLVQKFMLVMSPPMELIGNILEYVLNFHHSNGGFIGILRNIMHGLLDGRKKLDSEIRHGDPMYYPALSIMACKTVYSNAAYNKAVIEDSWKMEFLKFENYWNDYTGKPDTQVVMFRDRDVDHDTIVVCFRGTEPFNLNDWCSDVDLSWHEIRDAGGSTAAS